MDGAETTVVCRIQYSGSALALIAALALATLAVIAITPVAAPARVLAATWTVCAALAAAARVWPGKGGAGPRVLVVRLTGEVALCEAGGRWVHGVLRDGSFVAPWLLIVRWRPDGARWDRAVMLLPGMAQPDAVRKIRVILRRR